MQEQNAEESNTFRKKQINLEQSILPSRPCLPRNPSFPFHQIQRPITRLRRFRIESLTINNHPPSAESRATSPRTGYNTTSPTEMLNMKRHTGKDGRGFDGIQGQGYVRKDDLCARVYVLR